MYVYSIHISIYVWNSLYEHIHLLVFCTLQGLVLEQGSFQFVTRFTADAFTANGQRRMLCSARVREGAATLSPKSLDMCMFIGVCADVGTRQAREA